MRWRAAIVTKSVLLLLTLGTFASADAQGTVRFGNASTLPGWWVTADRNAHWDSSATNYSPLLQPGDLVSSNYAGLDLSFLRAALYYASPAIPNTTNLADFLPAQGGISTFKSSTSSTISSWFPVTATLDNVGYCSLANAVVVVWDLRLSSDPLSPIAQSGLWGRSAIFQQYTDCFAGSPADYTLQNLRAFNIGIPEPSAPALFGLAAAIAWLRGALTKRKQHTSGAAVVLSLFLLLGVTTKSPAQGNVGFANASTTPGWYVVTDRNVHWGSSATNYSPLLQPGDLVSSNYAGLDLSFLRAAFCYAPQATTNLADFVFAPESVATFKQSTSTTAGSWFTKTTTVPFLPLVLGFAVVWDVRLSPDPLSPAAQNGLWGRSEIFLQPTHPVLPPQDLFTQDLRSFTIGIPEPSAPALFGLAAAIAWLRRRPSVKQVRQV